MASTPGPCRAASAAAIAISLVGCARDPLPCEAIAPGAILVTEVRGPQNGEDGYGEWVELYNATGASIELRGVRVTLTRLDGGAQRAFAVRDEAVIESGDFFVVGRFASGLEPGHVDYGYATEMDDSLFDGAALDVLACGERIDRMIYRSLPSAGTYSLSGDLFPPTGSESNDDEADWCLDDTADDDTPALGLRGTPGDVNRPCS